MKNKLYIFTYLILSLTASISYAETVTIDHSTQRFLGTISELDRNKYFVLHSAASDTELDEFYKTYNVSKGRSFWGPYSYAKSKTGSVGKYPAARGGSNEIRKVRSGFVSTEHPANVLRYNTDIEAGAAWAAEYYKNFVGDNGRPEFFEPMNEPFVHADDSVLAPGRPSSDAMLLKMADWFGAIGKEFDNTPELANIKVIGYASAWPSVELRDFWHWNKYQKMFMDRAGDHIDGFATHLYDGINVTGQNNSRSGSNSEAILDLIEAYSHIKWGTIRPHAITEYGGIERGYGSEYSDIASSQGIRSFNHMIFNLLERQNDLLISIPFVTDKSTWHLNAGNNYQPYGPVLFRPSNLGEPTPESWEYTPRVLFFDLWKEFRGKRVEINSDNPDIQVQAFADKNKLFVALNNIDDALQTVNLNFVDGVSGLEKVRVKRLKIFENKEPQFNNYLRATAPASYSMISGETITLEYTFADDIAFDNAIRSKKYYSDTYLQAIKSGVTQTYNFNGVDVGAGNASLRMSIGRKRQFSKAPIIRVNGTRVVVPNNWTGYDQGNRKDFFGTIVIPFSNDLLLPNNKVTVEFPDSSGHLAALILQVEKYDTKPVKQEAYNGVKATIPGTIEIEHYDLGGQDVAYSDVDASNNGGGNAFRANEGVDTLASDGGIIIGWTRNTEWTEYTLDAKEGLYDLDLRFSTTSLGKSVVVNLDDKHLGTFTLPNTGSWRSFETIKIPRVNIEGGNDKILRLEYLGGGVGLNWLQFTPVVLEPELVNCTSIPKSIKSSKTLNIPIQYQTNYDRDIVLELWKGRQYITQTRTTVKESKGIVDIQFKLKNAPVAGKDYLIKTSLSEVGGTWMNDIDSCQAPNVNILPAF